MGMNNERLSTTIAGRGTTATRWNRLEYDENLPGRKGLTAATQNGSHQMPIKRVSPRAKSGSVFGQARRPAKLVRAGLYARVSTDDQQNFFMQSRACANMPRGVAGRPRQVCEVDSGAGRSGTLAGGI